MSVSEIPGFHYFPRVHVVLPKKRDNSRACYRRVPACERQQTCIPIDPERRDAIAALIARVEKVSGRVDPAMPGIVSPG